MDYYYGYKVIKNGKDFFIELSLHKKIMNEIIDFCKQNKLTDINEFKMSADGLKWSIKNGQWHPSTDSSFNLINDKRKQVLLSE